MTFNPYSDRGSGNTVTKTAISDVSGMTSTVSVFGDSVTAKRVPSASGQFFYGVDSRSVLQTITGGGTITLAGAVGFENLLSVSTSATASSTSGIQDTNYLRYVPGYEFGSLFTLLMTPPTGDGFIKAGLWDGFNGFWVGYKSDGGSQKFGVARVKDGTEYFTPQEDFNLDKLDGIGSSKMTIDTTKGNIFRIRGGYLGFATILFEIQLPDGQFIPYHRIEYPNSSVVTHISNTNLPAKVLTSNGTTAENVVAEIGSFTIYVTDGANATINDRDFSLGIPNIALVGGTYVRETIIAFRNPTTFKGALMPIAKENRIDALLNFFSTSIVGQNKSGLIELIIVDPSLNTGGSFTAKDADNSVLSYSTNATYGYDASEEVIFSDTFESTSDKLSLFLRDLKLKLRPGQDAVFALSSTTALDVDVTFSNAWSELF